MQNSGKDEEEEEEEEEEMEVARLMEYLNKNVASGYGCCKRIVSPGHTWTASKGCVKRDLVDQQRQQQQRKHSKRFLNANWTGDTGEKLFAIKNIGVLDT